MARVEQVFPHQEQCEVTLYHVPPGARTGPWQARVWELWTLEDGTPRKEIITAEEFVCCVSLVNGALSVESIERLVMHGVPAGATPHRDHTLPPRVEG